MLQPAPNKSNFVTEDHPPKVQNLPHAMDKFVSNFSNEDKVKVTDILVDSEDVKNKVLDSDPAKKTTTDLIVEKEVVNPFDPNTV